MLSYYSRKWHIEPSNEPTGANDELPKCMYDTNNTNKHHEVLCYTLLAAKSLLACSGKLRVAARNSFTRIERGCMATWYSPSSQYLCSAGKSTGIVFEVTFLLIQRTSEGVFRFDEIAVSSLLGFVTLQSVK